MRKVRAHRSHTVKDSLISLGISTQRSIVPYFPRVRDRADISVLRCGRSGVILLSSSDHMKIEHYNKKDFNGLGAHDRGAALRATAEDTARRYEQFKEHIAKKRWIDIGTGAGGILDALSPIAKTTVADEPQDRSRRSLLDLHYTAYPLIGDVKEKNFDVATLFHVLEHFTDPVRTLKEIRGVLKKGGKLIVEVPHAEDFLITTLDCPAFKAHTFWSEHLILHTKNSLRAFLKAAGFSKITITGFQRYPLANHLYWLSKGKPGGHKVWSHLRSKNLDAAYAEMLEQQNATDTLIAIAEA